MSQGDRLVSIANEIHDCLMLHTPQVTRVVEKAVQLLHDNASPAIVYLAGQPGCGLSTAVDGVFQATQSLRCRNVFKIHKLGADVGLPPEGMLLKRFGFGHGVSKSTSSKALPKHLFSLAQILGSSVLLIEDYLSGVVNIADKQQHINIWNKLATPPLQLKILLAGPYSSSERPSKKPPVNQCRLLIDEWQENEVFFEFLSELSALIKQKFKLNIRLVESSSSIFRNCKGNTATILEHVRQAAIYGVLSRSSTVSDVILSYSQKELVHENAKLYTAHLHS